MIEDLGLPEQPVDGYELSAHIVNGFTFSVCHMRYVYHVNASWQSVVDDGDPPGAPFVDDWQVICDGNFTARWSGWDAPAKYLASDRLAFLSRADALADAIRRAEERASRLEEEARELRALASELNEERARVSR